MAGLRGWWSLGVGSGQPAAGWWGRRDAACSPPVLTRQALYCHILSLIIQIKAKHPPVFSLTDECFALTRQSHVVKDGKVL